MNVFEVYHGKKTFVVNMKSTCRCFNLDRLSCKHALEVLRENNITDYCRYCSDKYNNKNLRLTYLEYVFQIGEENDWIIPDEVQNMVVLPTNC